MSAGLMYVCPKCESLFPQAQLRRNGDGTCLCPTCSVPLTKQHELGATKDFPQGKLVDDDEGGLKIAIASDKDKGVVILSFGKPVEWIGVDPNMADQIADIIKAHAARIRRG